jgi:hypothetical protein
MASQSEIPTPWIGVEDLPVHFANAFAVTSAPNAIFLVVGSVVPLDDDEAPYAPVKPVVRLAIAPDAMPGLIQVLQNVYEAREPKGDSA